MCVDSPWAGTPYDDVFHAIIEAEHEFVEKTGIKIEGFSSQVEMITDGKSKGKMGFKATGADKKIYVIPIDYKPRRSFLL